METNGMLSRLVDVFAVLVAGVGLMAAGAGLYHWLGPIDGNGSQSDAEQASASNSTPAPLLTRTQVFSLLEIDLLGSSSESAQECYSQGASNTKYEGGVWTIGLVGISCQGLQVYSVADETGEVASIFPVPTVALPPTPAPEGVAGLSTELIAAPTAIPEHANLVGFIVDYLVKSGEMDPECIRAADITAEVTSGGLGQGARWSVRAENDISTQLNFGCTRLHFYEVNEQTGEVLRNSGP